VILQRIFRQLKNKTMNTKTCLALLFAAILPVALSASPNNNRRNHDDRDHHPKIVASETSGFLSSSSVDQPVTVPDTASTLLLLGAGLGALVVWRRNSVFQIQ